MKKRGGFTLIELSLSLVFIAILSITVVLLIQNTMASYRRGVVLNQVNTVGMDLIDDIRSSVQYATSDPVTRMCEMYYDKSTPPAGAYKDCLDDNAYSFISVTKTVTKKIDGKDETVPAYGAFCTGTYTYIWNSGYLSGNEQVKLEGFDGDIRLLKVYDNERSVCVNTLKSKSANMNEKGNLKVYKRPDNNDILATFQVTGSTDDNFDDTVEMLDRKDANDLVLYDFYVSPPAESQTRQNIFYAASFILGTRRGGINIKQVGNTCKPPSDLSGLSELDYCAINNFKFAVQAGGK